MLREIRQHRFIADHRMLAVTKCWICWDLEFSPYGKSSIIAVMIITDPQCKMKLHLMQKHEFAAGFQLADLPSILSVTPQAPTEL